MLREQLPAVNKKPRIWIRGLLLNYVKLVHIITDAGLVFSYQRVQILSFGCIECDDMCLIQFLIVYYLYTTFCY